MTEAELLELLTEGIANVLALVSIYFTVVSAYIAALYYFLNRAPFLMRFVGFVMFSGAMLFLGLAAIGIERMLAGEVHALEALPERAAAPPPTMIQLYLGMDTVLAENYWMGIGLGWGVAAMVYLCMFYLTFLHRWEPAHAPQRAKGAAS